MKKIIFSMLLAVMLCLIGCESTKDVSDTGEMIMTARVIWASDDSLSVTVLPESSFGKEGELYSVSTKVSSPEGVPQINLNDTVEITFVGPVQETVPMSIPEGKVCAIRVTGKGRYIDDKGNDTTPTLPKPSVMVDGVLYESTGEARTVLRCGTLDGEITSSVDGGLLPTENDQSNFGEGYGYQFWTDGELDVVINNEWIIFKAALCGLPTAE